MATVREPKSTLLWMHSRCCWHVQVLSLWQITVAAVEAFPRSPDIVAMTNALAAEAGEPAAQTLIDAAESCNLGTHHVTNDVVMPQKATA